MGKNPSPPTRTQDSAFAHENDAPRKVNPNYPDWLTGLADKSLPSLYSYKELVGPDGIHEVENLRFGTFELEPDTVHPAHHHPAPEIYFITEGTGTWYVDDEVSEVSPGSVMYHRSGAVHGLKTHNKKLKAIWIWWAENTNNEALSQPSKLLNPERDNKKETAKPSRS